MTEGRPCDVATATSELSQLEDSRVRPPSSMTSVRIYTGPSAGEVAAQLPGSSQHPNAAGFWTLRGFCHGSGGKRGSTSLTVADRPDGGLNVRCFQGCSREHIIRVLETETGFQIWDAWDVHSDRQDNLARNSEDRNQPKRNLGSQSPAAGNWDSVLHAKHLWNEAIPIPPDPQHPSRRWLDARNLWWPQLPLPRAVRYLDAPGRWPKHQGVGAIITLYAPPAAWTASWPNLPTATAVELIHVDEDGYPALDRPREDNGLLKRTYGRSAGTLTILGDARPTHAHGLNLSEGLADALALASRRMESAASVGGTSGLSALADHPISLWLAAWTSLTLWADNDKPNQLGRRPGHDAARQLRTNLNRQGVRLTVLTLPSAKDAAEASANTPLSVLALDTVRDLAKSLMESDGLPRWEAARVAALTTT